VGDEFRVSGLPAEAVPANLALFYAQAQARAGAGHYQASMYRAPHQLERLEAVVAMLEWCAGQGARSCLEVGCCEGVMTARLAPLFEEVVAVDFTPELLAACPTLPGVTYEQHNAETWTPDRPFDVVVLSEVVEHLRDPLGVVRRLASRAEWLVVSTPVNETPNPRTFDPLLLGNEAAIGDAAGHVWCFAPGDLLALVEAAGLSVISQTLSGVTEIICAQVPPLPVAESSG